MPKHPISLIAMSLLCNACSQATTNLSRAESFIDAFYSFESAQLTPLLDSATTSRDAIVYYQGWASGGNYRVIERKPCMQEASGVVVCSVTVEDDLIGALGLDLNVTDTFHLTFTGDVISEVSTSSNDPDEFYAAQAWVQMHRPELIETPCQGFFADGTTPEECVRGMVAGFKAYSQSQDVTTESVKEPPSTES